MHRPAFVAAVLAIAAPAFAQNTATPPAAAEQPSAGQPSAGGSPFGAHDADRNGSLSRAEFTAMMQARSPAPGEADISAAFQRIDADRNGEISVEEARAAQGSQSQGNPSQ